MTEKEYALSPRAKKLLARVRDGHWYRAYDEKTPAAMQELVAAGLVGTLGRVQTLVRCYVPKGTKPPIMERYPK